MPYESPRNADEAKLQELQKERAALQLSIKKGKVRDAYPNVAAMVTRLRVVNAAINHYYLNKRFL